MNASVKLIELVTPATVALKAEIPDAHPSAQILGTERLGSGVVVDAAGLILTVNYVVLGAKSIEVTLLDDTMVEAKIVAQDFASGLAVVEIGSAALGAVPLAGSADLQLGQGIFIVAAAGENRRRANDGAITSLALFDAYWEYSLESAIVTTAMNPGFGGAPMLDMLGRVIGIVSLDLNEIGRFTLAIPVHHYVEHRDELLRHGRRVSRPARAWIGFYCYTFRDHVVIAGVLPGAPAERAGLKAGDVVLGVDDDRINGRHELYARLWAHGAGDPVAFKIFRNNEVRNVTVPSGNAEEFFA